MPLSKEEIGLLVKEARLLKGKKIGDKFTQGDLAESIGKSRSYIGDIETGRIYPSYRMLASIANACDVPLSFFGDSNSSLLREIINKHYSSMPEEEKKDFMNFIENNILSEFVEWDLDMYKLAYEDHKLAMVAADAQIEKYKEEIVFDSALEAFEFIIKQPVVVKYGGYEIDKMTDAEFKELVNDLMDHLKLLGYKYKNK